MAHVTDIIDNMGARNKTTSSFRECLKLGNLTLTLSITWETGTRRLILLRAPLVYRHYFTNKTYVGGQNVTVDAPLDEFPLFHVFYR
jgi:alpha-glucosidase (family GH31 glycosyl hydrolase)